MNFIVHNGKGMPVEPTTVVTVIRRDKGWTVGIAQSLKGWDHTYSPEDIMQYEAGQKAETKPSSAFQRQEGGDHYVNMAIQPSEYIHKNGIGYMEGTAIVYLSRFRAKGGISDLKKAIHTIEQLIEMEESK